MDVDKFKKYWESIGKPELEWKYSYTLVWNRCDGIAWPNNFDCRIKDDPHWELRGRWVDSDFTLPIEVFMASDEYGDDRWVLTTRPSWRADLRFREAPVGSKVASAHEKFRKYWESIGRPKLEIKPDDLGEHSFCDMVGPIEDIEEALDRNKDAHFRIKGDPHWELRKKWIDSDFTLPIEFFSPEIGGEGGRWSLTREPKWYLDLKYREAQVDDDGWIPHTPGDPMPVAGDVLTEAKRQDGKILQVQRADGRDWGITSIHERGIVAYKIHKYCPAEKVPLDLSEGWMPHTPGDPMPVAGNVYVQAERRDGEILQVQRADTREWGELPSKRCEIIAYRAAVSGSISDGSSSAKPEYEVNFVEPVRPYPTEVNEYGVNHPMYQGFMDAIDQATGGKGKRHGGATSPFLEQRWHNISKSTGFRGLVYQAVKKAEEATEKPDYESFERELLGSMVYLNMALIHVREHGYTTEVKVSEQ